MKVCGKRNCQEKKEKVCLTNEEKGGEEKLKMCY